MSLSGWKPVEFASETQEPEAPQKGLRAVSLIGTHSFDLSSDSAKMLSGPGNGDGEEGMDSRSIYEVIC